MGKIKTNTIISFLVSLSILLYAIRGKAGAIVTTLYIVFWGIVAYKNKGSTTKLNNYYGIIYSLFLIIFAITIGIVKCYNFEYYLFIGYFGSTLFLLNTKLAIYEKLWLFIAILSIFEALGIYFQALFPNSYYSLISLILPSSVVQSISNRLNEGYYTGFSREVSYSMFFIVLGLAVFTLNVVSCGQGKEKVWKKAFVIIFLLGALIISGKRATLAFFLISIIITMYIRSNDKLKSIKFIILGVFSIAIIIALFPVWSKLSVFSRLVELVDYISNKDIIGITNGRTKIYENAIDLWSEKKIFGIGWGNFKYLVPESSWYAGYDVHNCYLQVLCETGIIGAIPFYLLTLYSIIRFIKCINITRNANEELKNLASLVGFIQIFFLTYSMTEPILYEYSDYILYFIAINITSIILKNEKNYIVDGNLLNPQGKDMKCLNH